MKVHAILNREGGTLRTTDLDLLSSVICDEFRLHGHEIDVVVLGSADIGEEIRKQVARENLDVLMVGGGDGTVASAASAVAGSSIALGLLPASAATGTWNPPTADAVRRFQADRGLDPSGVAGSATAGRLFAA